MADRQCYYLLELVDAAVKLLVNLVGGGHLSSVVHDLHLQVFIDDQMCKFFEVAAAGGEALEGMAVAEPTGLAEYFVGLEAAILEVFLVLRVAFLKLIEPHPINIIGSTTLPSFLNDYSSLFKKTPLLLEKSQQDS